MELPAKAIKEEVKKDIPNPLIPRTLAVKPANENKYMVVCGPSGVGKGTLLKELFAKFPSQSGFSVSYTTRKPRPGEVDGKDYNFVAEEDFVSEIDAGNF